VLFVGNDCAENHHDVEVVDESGRRLARRRFPEGVAGMADLHALIAAGYQVYAVNPMRASRYRDRYSASGAKSDRGAARVLAELVRLDRAHHRRLAGGSDLSEAVKVLARRVRRRHAPLRHRKSTPELTCPRRPASTRHARRRTGWCATAADTGRPDLRSELRPRWSPPAADNRCFPVDARFGYHHRPADQPGNTRCSREQGGHDRRTRHDRTERCHHDARDVTPAIAPAPDSRWPPKADGPVGGATPGLEPRPPGCLHVVIMQVDLRWAQLIGSAPMGRLSGAARHAAPRCLRCQRETPAPRCSPSRSIDTGKRDARPGAADGTELEVVVDPGSAVRFAT
jgi:hypothetical protein